MTVSVLAFGAFGDGLHDDYAAFQAALDAGADTVTVPQGIYLISDTLKIGSNTAIVADRGAKIVMKSKARRQRNDFLLSNKDTANGNESIKIEGGIWDGNNTAPENAKPDIFDKTGYSGALLSFVGVKGLTLRDMVLANTTTYYLRLSRVHHFEIESIDFVSDAFGVNQDGLHLGGDVRHGRVKNVRALSYGQTNDDMIALNADDSVERVENLDLSRDTIEDISFENIFTENCHTVIRMLSVTAEIKNIRFKNIFGGFRCNAINADAARYCRTPLFEEEDLPSGAGKISDIYIEGFTCYPVTSLPEGFGGTNAAPRVALMLESQMDDFRIKDFRYACDEEAQRACPAAKFTHLCGQKICADGKEYVLKDKSDTLTLDSFKSISVNKIKQ